MAEYNITITGFDSGLNEILNSVYYDYRTKKLYNREKKKNDDLIIRQLRKSALKNVKLKTPIEIYYKFYCKDKRHDRMNVASGFEKSYADSLQKAGILNNDGWNDIVGVYFDWDIDKANPRIEVTIKEVENG